MDAVFSSNTNQSSTVFYLGGFTKAKLRNSQKIGVRIGANSPTP